MKKIFAIAILAITVFASCSKFENDPVSVNQEINFVVATQMAATKANTSFTYDNFASYAYYADTQSGNEVGTAMYENEAVTLQGNFWSTAEKHYWPKKGTLTFLAYAPKTGAKAIAPSSVTPTQMVWTNAAIYEKDADLLYADKAINVTNSDDTNAAGKDKGVTTVFNHAASQVEIVVVPAYTTDNDKTTWEIVLKSFKLEGINKVGTCTVKVAEGGNLNSEWETPVWTASSAETITYSTEKTLTNAAPSVAVIPTHMMVPQTISENAKIIAKVDIITKVNGNQINKVVDYEFTGLLKNAKDAANAAVTTWRPGTSYKYTIKLTPADSRDENGNPTDRVEDARIKFDPVTNDWSHVNCTLSL